MTFTIGFIIILIAVSGLIAYLGDILGRRMGKRRLTLFGLRPRYTAIVMTTITGMLIAGLTFATMITLSSDLREVLVRGERILKDIHDYQAKNKELRDKNTGLTKASEKLSKEVRKRAEEVRKKSEQVRSALKEVEEAARARDEARSRVNMLQADIESRQKELQRLIKKGDLTEEELRRISDDLATRQDELDNVRADFARKDEELTEKLKDLSVKDMELAHKQEQLKEADDNIAKAEELIQEKQTQLASAMRLTNFLYTGDVVIQQGQEIGRKVIDNSLPTEQIRAELIDLLDTADKRAKQYQAGSKSEGRVIQLMFDDKKTGGISFDEKAAMDSAVEAISNAGRDSQVHGVLTQLIVVNNTLKGEKAIVILKLYWNSLKFRRGEKIASRVIDGRLSEGRILLAVNDFLGEDIRAAAEKAGVLPVASPDPNNVDEAISGRQLDELIDLVEKIRSENARIELYARAKQDIYAVGPLNMDNIQFAISELPSVSR